MKNYYEDPRVTIMTYDVEDILTTSGDWTPDTGNENTGGEGGRS